jgi:hypothetical protein
MTTRLIAAIFALSVVSLGAQSQPPAPSSREHIQTDQPQPEGDNGPRGQQPAISGSLVPTEHPARPQQAETPQTETDNQKRNAAANNGWTSPPVIVAMIYDALTAGVFVFLALQWSETAKAATAAAQSANVAARGLAVLNRPWIDTDKWKFSGEFPSPQDMLTLAVQCEIVNLGSTPARIRYISGRFRALVAANSATGYVNPGPVNHVINPKRSYAWRLPIGPLGPVHVAQYRSAEGFQVEVVGTVFFDDVFHLSGSAPPPPEPFNVDSPFEGRKWHFARTCTLRPSHDGCVFEVPFGAEGVGANDEDWSKGKD